METIAVVFWSGSGNTERMSSLVAEGIEKNGSKAVVIQADSFGPDEVPKYSKIAFGCPAMGDEVLEEEVFEPMFSSVEGMLSGKKLALFGSYDWGDGLWMRDWEDRCKKNSAVLVSDGVIVMDLPDAAGAEDCRNLGAKLASF